MTYVSDPFSDRFCIKVPTTTAGAQAAVILLKDNIRTLGTSLFSLPQAIAASQAGMLSISPYYNGEQSSKRIGSGPDPA